MASARAYLWASVAIIRGNVPGPYTAICCEFKRGAYVLRFDVSRSPAKGVRVSIDGRLVPTGISGSGTAVVVRPAFDQIPVNYRPVRADILCGPIERRLRIAEFITRPMMIPAWDN